MKEHVELVTVDVSDSQAISHWARGMCRGQSIQSLAAYYEVEPAALAISREVAKDLPEPARSAAMKVCMQALEGPEPAIQQEPADMHGVRIAAVREQKRFLGVALGYLGGEYVPEAGAKEDVRSGS